MAQPTLTAVQPDAVTALEADNVPIKPQAVQALGAMLLGRFKQYEWDRRTAELLWTRNARQYQGIYDPDIERSMDPNRSRAYPKITRVKCVSMLSRLMNLLFPADDKNWSVCPSAVPELAEDDLQQILDTLYPPPDPNAGMVPAQGNGAPPAPPQIDNDKIEQAIRDFAKKRADRMGLEIEDQLEELGGDKLAGYVHLCRKVLQSGIQYGAGILKGPFVESSTKRTWSQDASGKVTAQTEVAYRPRFDWVPIWDYYPDMSAKALHQMDGQFERVVLTRHQLLELKNRPDFMGKQIDLALRTNPSGNYVRRSYETELFADGPQINSQSQGNASSKNKFEIYCWDGHVTGRELQDAGNVVPDDKLDDDMKAQVWLVGDIVIKAKLNPWTTLKQGDKIRMYHHFIFEESETFLMGNGLPNIVRDSQMSICAAARMALDNASIQRNVEVNLALLSPNQDVSSVEPDKVWYRDDDDLRTVQYPAIRSVDLPMHLTEMTQLVQMFQSFADSETFVNAATGGDMAKGPSEPYRTAAGASMLRGDAALPFKDVVRNFDAFTVSVINSILIFNKNFNPNPDIDGDFQPVARGATSLIAKEVLGSQLDQLASTISAEEKQYLKPRNLLRARVRVRDLQTDDIVMNDSECDAVDAAAAQKQQSDQQNQQQMIQAQVRETLSAALKNLTQAGKNSAASEAASANVILDALEKGINPDTLTPQGAANGQSPDAGTGNQPSGSQPAAAANGPSNAALGGSSAMPLGNGVVSAAPIAQPQDGQGDSSAAAMPSQ